MPLRFACVVCLVAVVPACSALVDPDTTRLGGGTDAGHGAIDGGTLTPDTGMPPVDGGGTCTGGCDDLIPCTTDSCDAASSSCHHVPNNGACAAGFRCSATLGCVAMACTGNADCADGNACNGTEMCAPGAPGADSGGCVPGTALDCNDHIDCTGDSCNMATGCAHELHDAACNDTFACTTDTCTTAGCHHETDDAMCNAGCFSGATCDVGVGCNGGSTSSCAADGNPCTSDPVDCDPGTGMCLHPPRDGDGDGHAIAVANGTSGPVTCPGGDDCNDSNPNIFPGAPELCNGVDDNCNMMIDESGCLPPGPDSCATETAIMLSSSGGPGRMGTVSGSTQMDTDNYTSLCGHMNGRDAVYYVDLAAGVVTGAVDVTFSTDNAETAFDTVLAATVGATCTTGLSGTRLCNDDVSGSNFRSHLTVCVPASVVTGGTRVHVMVDGFDGTAFGNYQLDVSVMSHTGVCP